MEGGVETSDIRSIFKVVKIKLSNRDSHIHFISRVHAIESDMSEQQHINASNTHDALVYISVIMI